MVEAVGEAVDEADFHLAGIISLKMASVTSVTSVQAFMPKVVVQLDLRAATNATSVATSFHVVLREKAVLVKLFKRLMRLRASTSELSTVQMEVRHGPFHCGLVPLS